MKFTFHVWSPHTHTHIIRHPPINPQTTSRRSYSISFPLVQPPEQPVIQFHILLIPYPMTSNTIPHQTSLSAMLAPHLQYPQNLSFRPYKPRQIFIPPPLLTLPPLRNVNAIILQGSDFVRETAGAVEELLQRYNTTNSEPYILQYSEDSLSCISFLTPDPSGTLTYLLTLCGLRTEDIASATTLIANILHTEREQFRFCTTVVVTLSLIYSSDELTVSTHHTHTHKHTTFFFFL